MKPREFLLVDPAALHLPSSRRDGADPIKLHRQVAKHGFSIEGMQTMSSAEQIRRELLAALSRLSQIRPEWRLGQTLANLAMTAGCLDPGGVWDLEDEEALVAARTLIEQYSDVESVVAEPSAAYDRDRS